MNHFSNKNYFTMPNEIFSLGLDASEIAVYAYLRCLESRSTYQCWPSYTTIGNAVGRAKNTVMRYVDALAEKGLIYTEPTSVLMRSGIKKNGSEFSARCPQWICCPAHNERKGTMKHSTYTSYDELPLMLSVAEVAAVLGISRAGAYELARSNSFPALKIGSRIVVPKDKFLAWIDANSGSKNAPL